MFGFRKKEASIGKRRGLSKLGKLVATFAVIAVLSGSVLTTKPKESQAICVTVPCWACGIFDVLIAALLVKLFKEIFGPIIEENLEDHVNSEQNWILDEFFEDYWVVGVAELTEFLGAFGMYQVEVVGMFFDAKNQLETRRMFNQMSTEAHKDYHPSEGICWYGTNARSLMSSERRSDLNKLFLSKFALERQLGNSNSIGATSDTEDQATRWKHFIRANCDPKDNGWNGAGTGLDLACDHDGLGGSTLTGAADRKRMNKDIDYTKLIDAPRTLDVNFSDVGTPAADEQDVLSMSMNLYGHDVLSRTLGRKALANEDAQNMYLTLRSVAAKRSVAQNSFNAIVALKSQGTNGVGASALPADVGHFMAAAIRDLMPVTVPPMSDDDIYAILGRNPSYYAQLEFLAKRIYQNPKFFANLYDKPANVERKSVAMKAIELMLDRALYESELRQEMVLSVLLSSELQAQYRKVNKDLSNTEGKR